MAKIKFSGPLSTCLTSFGTLSLIALKTYLRRAFGKKLDPSWSADIDIGIYFWRHQFTKAMTHPDIKKGRQIFDSLQTDTDDIYETDTLSTNAPPGTWYLPHAADEECVVLYFHGGGYTFNGPISERFASMFAHHTNMRLFMPHYRLTPEHPHPAQAEDALTAWRYVNSTVPAKNIVVMGDSAGGHMALMLLQNLKREGLPQPALCIGLCPWTDIGDRGKSLHENNYYDLVQGWMALQFGVWLDPGRKYGREALSPVSHDYSGLAPLYLQTGGRDILRDMTEDFANIQLRNGATLVLDKWQDMPHNFHAYDSLMASSTQALRRIRAAIDTHTGKDQGPFPSIEGVTVCRGDGFAGDP